MLNMDLYVLAKKNWYYCHYSTFYSFKHNLNFSGSYFSVKSVNLSFHLITVSLFLLWGFPNFLQVWILLMFLMNMWRWKLIYCHWGFFTLLLNSYEHYWTYPNFYTYLEAHLQFCVISHSTWVHKHSNSRIRKCKIKFWDEIV